MPYRPAHFSIPGVQGPYAGYTDDERWNGWACPYFERTVTDRVAADFIATGEGSEEGPNRAEYEAEQDRFLFFDPFNPDEPAKWYGTDIEVDGETVHVYPIGSWEWTWEEASPAPSGTT